MTKDKNKTITLSSEIIQKGNVVASMSGTRLKAYIEDKIYDLILKEFEQIFKNGHTN